MYVKAADPAVPVPREDNPRTYITDEPVAIELSHYYVQRLADGELVEAPAPKKPGKAVALA